MSVTHRCSVHPVTRHSPFTLIELLVVIAIIGILASLLMPALRTARDKALSLQCQSNLRQIYIGLSTYAADYDGWFPIFAPHGAPPGQPWAPNNSIGYPVFNQYFGYKYGEDYNQYGPLKSSCVWFCSEFAQRNKGRQAAHSWPYASFGYAVNFNYNRGWVFSWYEYTTKDLKPGIRPEEIDKPAFTILFREHNPPYSVDYYIDGNGLWPSSGMASAKYGRIHMDGQNILYADGHTRHFTWPRDVEGQVKPGWDHLNH